VSIYECADVHGGPLVAHGRTVIPIARVRRVHVAIGHAHFTRVWARPRAVEVIEADGSHHKVPIRDTGGFVLGAAQVVPTLLAMGLRGRTARRERGA
jgi:hypothetical protein